MSIALFRFTNQREVSTVKTAYHIRAEPCESTAQTVYKSLAEFRVSGREKKPNRASGGMNLSAKAYAFADK